MNIDKKDKYQRITGNSTAEFNHLRQQWNIARWCREQGIDPRTIEQHPCVADIRTLLDFDSYDHLMSAKDKQIWAHAWNWVYKKQLPISVYIEKRLLSIVENCKRTEYIIKRKQRQSQQVLDEIKKAAGLKTSEIGDHNNEAKGSQSADKTIIYSL